MNKTFSTRRPLLGIKYLICASRNFSFLFNVTNLTTQPAKALHTKFIGKRKEKVKHLCK